MRVIPQRHTRPHSPRGVRLMFVCNIARARVIRHPPHPTSCTHSTRGIDTPPLLYDTLPLPTSDQDCCTTRVHSPTHYLAAPSCILIHTYLGGDLLLHAPQHSLLPPFSLASSPIYWLYWLPCIFFLGFCFFSQPVFGQLNMELDIGVHKCMPIRWPFLLGSIRCGCSEKHR